MKRRSLLTAIGSICVVSAGCTSSGNSNTDGGLADGAKEPLIDFEMRSVTPMDVARKVPFTYNLDSRKAARQIAEQTIPSGEVTKLSVDLPAPENKPFVYQDSVWEFRYDIVDSVPATIFRLEFSEVKPTDTETESIKYSDLPQIDKAKLKEIGWADGPTFGTKGIGVVYREKDLSDSELFPTPSAPVLSWPDGAHAKINILRKKDTQLHSYRYTSRLENESAKKFGQSIINKYVMTISDLPDEQAEIISNAISRENGYEVRGTELPDPANKLIDRFSQAKPIGDNAKITKTDSPVSNVDGKYIIRYDGSTYWATLSSR